MYILRVVITNKASSLLYKEGYILAVCDNGVQAKLLMSWIIFHGNTSAIANRTFLQETCLGAVALIAKDTVYLDYIVNFEFVILHTY